MNGTSKRKLESLKMRTILRKVRMVAMQRKQKTLHKEDVASAVIATDL